MYSFKSFLENKILSEVIDYDKLQFPPMAYGNFGKYFIGPSGEIHYQVAGQNGNQNGVAHVNNFLPIYQNNFAKHITPEMAKQFKEKYVKHMKYEQDKVEQNTLPFPEIFNSPAAKWVAQDNQVLYKIKTAQGEQKGMMPVNQFADYYKKNMANFGKNQLDNITPDQKEATKQMLNQELK